MWSLDEKSVGLPKRVNKNVKSFWVDGGRDERRDSRKAWKNRFTPKNGQNGQKERTGREERSKRWEITEEHIWTDEKEEKKAKIMRRKRRKIIHLRNSPAEVAEMQFHFIYRVFPANKSHKKAWKLRSEDVFLTFPYLLFVYAPHRICIKRRITRFHHIFPAFPSFSLGSFSYARGWMERLERFHLCKIWIDQRICKYGFRQKILF